MEKQTNLGHQECVRKKNKEKTENHKTAKKETAERRRKSPKISTTALCKCECIVKNKLFDRFFEEIWWRLNRKKK